MCSPSCIEFGREQLRREDISGKRVIEVGAQDVNGGLRWIVESFGPSEYVTVDIQHLPGVDVICDACDLVEKFGAEAFDVLISTEVIEHVRHWRSGISNFKKVLAPNGVILITTRSIGFPYHGYPLDFWRYELVDMRELFADFTIEALLPDTVASGVFMKARKPRGFRERSLGSYALYSILRWKRVQTVSDLDVLSYKFRAPIRHLAARALPRRVKAIIEALLSRL